MENGIYPERPISYVKIGMILIGLNRIQEDPGIFSLHFTGRDTGSWCLWERVCGKGMDGVVEFFLKHSLP